MPVDKSKNYFHGKEGYNCAQSIAAAFCHCYDNSHELIAELKTKGGGKADEGLCGALYAAEVIADEEKAKIIRQRFKDEVGEISCRDIKIKTRTPCIHCIEVAARILEEELGDISH